MSKRSCFKDFLTYSSLNVLSMVGLSCYILADTFFVAKRLGADGLAALNIAIPIFSLIYGSGLMIGIGGAIRYNIMRSRGCFDDGNAAFTHSVILASVMTVIFYIIGFFFVEPLVKVLGADAQIMQMTETYVRVLFFFSPAYLINSIIQSFVRNDGKPQLAMAAMVSGSLSNILFDYILMFIFNMDILGAVLATGFSPVISLAIMAPHMVKGKNNFHLCRCKISGKTIKRILAGGLPSLVTEISSGAVIVVFNLLILNMEGNIGVAAYGVIANLSIVVISVYTGIAQGIQPILSKYYAVGNKKDLITVLKYALASVLILSLIIYLFIFFKAEFITLIFNSENNTALTEIAVTGLKLYFIGCLFAGINIVMSSYFISTSRTLPANIISFLRGIILIIPAAAVLAMLCGMNGLWLSFPLTEILVAVTAGVFVIIDKSKHYM